jgi:sigma-B regulation protein RsbU (phosphoserine phosphatase)
MHLSTDSASYATFFYAQFDEHSRLLTYVNAGHNPPILVRSSAPRPERLVGEADGRAVATVPFRGPEVHAIDSRVRLLSSGGPIIGAFSDCEYEQETIQLEPGDVLIAYTDGLTEAMNSGDEQFGEARLREIARRSVYLSATEISDEIVEQVRGWCGGTAQQDDLTLVVLKVKP